MIARSSMTPKPRPNLLTDGGTTVDRDMDVRRGETRPNAIYTVSAQLKIDKHMGADSKNRRDDDSARASITMSRCASKATACTGSMRPTRSRPAAKGTDELIRYPRRQLQPCLCSATMGKDARLDDGVLPHRYRHECSERQIDGRNHRSRAGAGERHRGEEAEVKADKSEIRISKFETNTKFK